MNYTEGQMRVLEEDAGLAALTEKIWQNFNFKICCMEQKQARKLQDAQAEKLTS